MVAELQGLEQPLQRVWNAHVQNVRYFMRDFSGLNQLIAGEESSDRMIIWATMDFLSNFNGTPPFSSYGLEELFQYNLQHLAIRGTAITLLQSVMILNVRNHLPFSDGGLSIQIHDKGPMIQAMLSVFQSAYEQEKRQVKTAINVAGLLDEGPSGVHSDYLALAEIGVF